MMKKIIHFTHHVILYLIIISALFNLSVQAGTLCVTTSGGGGCYSSIQEAVNDAQNDDTIRVAEGVYLEKIEIDKKNLILEGGWNDTFTERDFNTRPTTVDAQRTGNVIYIEAAKVTIDGFVITQGDGSATLGWGGGIWVHDNDPDRSSVIIRNNTIIDNIACDGASCQGIGGGIMVYDSDAIIENNHISNNIAQKNPGKGGQGGGIAIHWQSTATISGNEISTNTAAVSPTGFNSGDGGGIYTLVGGGEIIVKDNLIYDNIGAIDGKGYGGGAYGTGNYLNNRIIHNVASTNGEGFGGGLYSHYIGDFRDNWIQNNIASLHGDGTGGGICAVQLQTANNNWILTNQAKRGGGIYLKPYSRTSLRFNVIYGNIADGSNSSTNDGGGGISTEDDRAEIRDNLIMNNLANLAGGGILITAGTQILIKNNQIDGNMAFAGGGICFISASGSIIQNRVINNSAYGGGGMFAGGKSEPLLDGNIIMKNNALGFLGAAGGGVYVNVDPTYKIILKNHIITQNTAGSGGPTAGVQVVTGICYLIHCTIAHNAAGVNKEGIRLTSTDGTHIIWNSIISGHSTGMFVGAGVATALDYNDYYKNLDDITGALKGPHDRTDDPAFANPTDGDYHLSLNSLLINKGDNLVSTDKDFEGDLRPHNKFVDIGADESFHNEIFVSVSSGSDLLGDGSMAKPYASIKKGLTEVQSGGGVYVGSGIYKENLDIQRNVNLQGGYEPPFWIRNISKYTTVIDGFNNGTVVSIHENDVVVLLEGFTIKNGGAKTSNDGGGVRIYGKATATIRSNIITDNHAKNSGGGITLINDSQRLCVVDSNRIYNNKTFSETPSPSMPSSPQIKVTQGAFGFGGGMLIEGGPTKVINNFIYGNEAAEGGDGIFAMVYGRTVGILNNTLADNRATTGEGIRLGGDPSSTLVLHNNLIVGQTIGIVGRTGAS